MKKLIKGVRSPTDTQHDIHMRSIQGFRIYPEEISVQSDGESSVVREIGGEGDLGGVWLDYYSSNG